MDILDFTKINAVHITHTNIQSERQMTNWSFSIFNSKCNISALLTMLQPLTVWITINCGKFWKRWEYQTTWTASWEICMQVRKQQLELLEETVRTALRKQTDHSVIFEIASKYCILDSFADYYGYSISSKGFFVVDIMIIWVKFTQPTLHFSLLISKMSMLTLAIPCLTTSNLPSFMDLTFQVLIHYCFLQHWT